MTNKKKQQGKEIIWSRLKLLKIKTKNLKTKEKNTVTYKNSEIIRQEKTHTKKKWEGYCYRLQTKKR